MAEFSLPVEGDISDRNIFEHIICFFGGPWLRFESFLFSFGVITYVNILNSILAIHVHVTEVDVLRIYKLFWRSAIVPI